MAVVTFRDVVFIGSVALFVTGAATMHPALGWVTGGTAGLLVWLTMAVRARRTE